MINLDIVYLFQTVNFLVLLFLLNLLLYKPIRKAIRQRETEIVDSREKTVSVDLEVRERMALYEEKLRQVKSEAVEERNRMLHEARTVESGIFEEARRDAADTMSQMRDVVRADAESAESLLRDRAAELSKVICEKVLGRSLS